MTHTTPKPAGPTRQQFQDALDEVNELGAAACLFEVDYDVIRYALKAMADDAWQLVPKEPTEKMETAGDIEYGCACWNAYKPMLSAAPIYPGEKHD